MNNIGKHQIKHKTIIKSIIVSMIVFSLFFSVCPTYIDHADATVLLVYECNIGAIFHNGTYLQMPEVNVHSIYTQDTGSLNISYEYEIFTNTTQIMTLAIVYPSWSGGSYLHYNVTANMAITLNSSHMNHRTLPWVELGWNSSDYSGFNFEEDWFFDALYAVLDLTLFENTTSIINVNIQDEAKGVDFFFLNHFVGSTRIFDSESHQRIHVEIVDENDLLTSSSFQPPNFSSIDSHDDTTDAIWDFNLSEFNFDAVKATLWFNIYHPPDHILLPYPLVLAVGLITIATVIVIVYYRRHQ